MREFGSSHRLLAIWAVLLLFAAVPTADAAGQTAATSKAKSKKVTFAGGTAAYYVGGGEASGAMAGDGISHVPQSPAAFDNGGIEFPIDGGSMNPKTMVGRLELRGGLGFKGLSEGAYDPTIKLLWNRFYIAVNRRHDRNGRLSDYLRLDTSDAGFTIKGRRIKSWGTIRVWLTDPSAADLTRIFGVQFNQGLFMGSLAISGTISHKPS